MRTVLSIPLIFLLLFTGVNVKFARHYCKGEVAATKISLSGELATCGMENHKEINPFGEIFTNQCCEDVVSAYSFNNNYFGSSYNIADPGQQGTHMFIVPHFNLLSEILILNKTNSNQKPPGINDLHTPTMQTLCIFRI